MAGMAGGGNGRSRLDRLEKIIESLGEVVKGLVDHAELTDKRLDKTDMKLDRLTDIVTENNERIGDLVSAIGAYIKAQG
jgi:hypothetical protein